MKPVHPGEVLQEEFLTPLGLSQHRLALDLLRLARYFNTSPEFWLGLQSQHDLDVEGDASGDRIAKEVKAYFPNTLPTLRA